MKNQPKNPTVNKVGTAVGVIVVVGLGVLFVAGVIKLIMMMFGE